MIALSPRLPAVALAAALAVTGLSACGSSGARAGGHGAVAVQASVSACGQGWTDGRAGPVDLMVHNTDSRAGEVDLIAPASKKVYAEIEPLGPGTSERVRADLGAGRYALRCSMEDEPSVAGPTIRLTGKARGTTPGVVPVAQADLLPAIAAYKSYVLRQLPGLLRLVRRLAGDVHRADLPAARHDWLPAHLAYQRLGAAYGAFGDTDAAINGLAEGLPAGVHDRSWQGFHRLEYGLWHGQPARELDPVAAGLVASVNHLIRHFPSVEIDPLDIGIRAHEITEDAVRFALTGRDDYGSHTDLDTIRADLAATRVVLGIVHHLLVSRYTGLPRVNAWLDRTGHELRALPGRGVIAQLPRPQHERIDGDVSELAELLAPVAMILEPRRTS